MNGWKVGVCCMYYSAIKLRKNKDTKGSISTEREIDPSLKLAGHRRASQVKGWSLSDQRQICLTLCSTLK